MKNIHIFFANISLIFCMNNNLNSMEPNRNDLLVKNAFLTRKKMTKKTLNQNTFVQEIRNQKSNVLFVPAVQTFFIKVPVLRNKVIPVKPIPSNTSSTSASRKAYYNRRRYSCPFIGCPSTFVRNSELERHRVVHTKEQPFTCEKCEKKFSYKHSLKAHSCRDVHGKLCKA